MPDFNTTYRNAYGFQNPAIDLGNVLRDNEPQRELPVRIPLAMMNRHGLIAGSTGTGKTRTLQLLAEGLSATGVSVFLADVKGDLAGMVKPGVENEKIKARMGSVGRTFTPQAFPVEFFSLTGKHGAQIRATVSSFGPLLLAKVLDLTDTQQSVLSMVFKYCDDQKPPLALLDLADLKEVLNYLAGPGKDELKNYGGMSPATVGVLVRKMVELEQQGAANFFGEPELDIHDLMRTVDGRGVVNILSLSDVQDKPRLFSTFLMWLLGQFYFRMPEVGDAEKPKLVFFFDEAHLLFEDSSSALVEHIEQVARLIRSKAIGVFFITQTPKDVDEDVLSQLGNRIQHAVRVFTPTDAKNLKATASTFPASEFFAVDKVLPSLGIGVALVTVLDPRGVPTPVASTQILAPSSSMAAIDEGEYAAAIARSAIASKYANAIDRESAHEILQRKIAESVEEVEPAPRTSTGSRRATGPSQPRGVVEEVLRSRMAQNVARQATRTITQQVVRGIFGMLKGK